jgi:serine/threonine-protein kinase
VRVLFRHETPGALYTVRERVEGPTLEDVATWTVKWEENLSEAFILHVGAELASALAHLHSRGDEHGRPLGIVHRNLNPSFIVFTWRGGVKLADFSLAYSNLSGRRATTARPPRAPVFYTAPETLFAGNVDARSDLFALGLVLLELATGRHLYDPLDKMVEEQAAALSPRERQRVERAVREAKKAGHDDLTLQALWGAATFTLEDVGLAAEGLPAPLTAMIARLLRREPAERFQTAAELEDALRTRLAVVGPYDGAAAVAEFNKAVGAVGQAHVAHEVNPRVLAPAPTGVRSSPEAITR